MAKDIILQQIFIYPVKSLAGIEVSAWPVAKTGFRHDRQWMLIDKESRFLSQRRLPEMVLIKPELTDTALQLSAPGMTPIQIPLQPETDDRVAVEIWHDHCQAVLLEQKVNQWFSDFLKIDCRLVFHPQQAVRPVDPAYAAPADQVAFADGFPFLVLSQASLDALNQTMGLSLPIIRFRPNLVISGCSAYAEDSWREIQIGEIGFRLPKPCSRCAIPGIDPVTAERSAEPMQTLLKVRKWQKHVYFGQNALHDRGGQLTVGMPVNIIKTGPARPPLAN